MNINLNLIPQYRKAEIRNAHQLRIVLKWQVQLAVALAVFIAMLASLIYILKVNQEVAAQSSYGSAGNAAQYRKIEDYDNRIKEINTKVSAIMKIQKAQLNWSRFFQTLNDVSSESIAIEKIATENYEISLAGRAADRDKLIDFKNELEKSQCFEKVEFPLSNLVARENIDFQIKLTLKKDCLNPR